MPIKKGRPKKLSIPDVYTGYVVEMLGRYNLVRCSCDSIFIYEHAHLHSHLKLTPFRYWLPQRVEY